MYILVKKILYIFKVLVETNQTSQLLHVHISKKDMVKVNYMDSTQSDVFNLGLYYFLSPSLNIKYHLKN
jgi:hypothetical protein